MLVAWNGETTPDLPLQHEIAIAARAGFQGIELFTPKLSGLRAEREMMRLRSWLGDAGLLPVALNCIENINVTAAGEIRSLQEECKHLSEIAQAIDSPGIVIVPGPRPADAQWKDVVQTVAESVARLAQTAATYGRRVGIEFVEPPTASVRTLAEALEILQAAGQENAGVVIDMFHLYLGGSDPEAVSTLDPADILVVHIDDAVTGPGPRLSDADRLLPGEGTFLSRTPPLHSGHSATLERSRSRSCAQAIGCETPSST